MPRATRLFIRIRGKLHHRWHAIDQDGQVLDILVQSRRNAKAAKRFFRKLLKDQHYMPRVIVTNKLRSYGVAQRAVPPMEQAQVRSDVSFKLAMPQVMQAPNAEDPALSSQRPPAPDYAACEVKTVVGPA